MRARREAAAGSPRRQSLPRGGTAMSASAAATPRADAGAGRGRGSVRPPPRQQPAAPQRRRSHSLLENRAGFWIRMLALLLDVILVAHRLLDRQIDTHNALLLIVAAYGAVMWKLRGTTIGGIVCGLRVVRLDGRAIDWPTAITRALALLPVAVRGRASDSSGWCSTPSASPGMTRSRAR